MVRLKANKINKTYKQLESRFGREPSDVEMCEEMEVSLDDFQSMVEESKATTMFSLSDKWDDDNDDNAVEKTDILTDARSEDPIESLNRRDVIDAITRNLSQKERRIVIMYYYEGLTMKEIGKILDLTESRVCQIHTNVVARLRDQMDKTRSALAS